MPLTKRLVPLLDANQVSPPSVLLQGSTASGAPSDRSVTYRPGHSEFAMGLSQSWLTAKGRSRDRGPSVVGRLFVGIPEPDQRRFRERPSHELNPNGEPVCREPCGHG